VINGVSKHVSWAAELGSGHQSEDRRKRVLTLARKRPKPRFHFSKPSRCNNTDAGASQNLITSCVRRSFQMRYDWDQKKKKEYAKDREKRLGSDTGKEEIQAEM
jgi:hypothetical protein